MVVIIDHAAIRIAWIGVQEPIWIARIIRIIAVKTWIIRWPASRAITRDDGLERADSSRGKCSRNSAGKGQFIERENPVRILGKQRFVTSFLPLPRAARTVQNMQMSRLRPDRDYDPPWSIKKSFGWAGATKLCLPKNRRLSIDRKRLTMEEN